MKIRWPSLRGLQGFLGALAFLTVAPVPGLGRDPAALAGGAVWFPVVGLLLGGALACAHLLLATVLPPLAAAALVVALWALLTGGLHLDGVADSLDGLLAPVSPARRLEILHDPHTGAFGQAGLTLFLILKVAAVDGLHPGAALWLLLAPAAARWAMLLTALGRPARSDGMGFRFSPAVRLHTFLVASTAPLAVFFIMIALGGMAPWRPLVGLLAALGAASAALLAAHRRLGGVTGDVLGLAVEAAELATLLAGCLGRWA